VAFSLTALFVVLTIEQYRAKREITPFVIGAISSVVALMLLGADMLLGSIVLSLVMLFSLRGYILQGRADG